MGRPLPATIHELRGNPGKRKRPPELKPDPIMPEMPAWLSPIGRATWKYLAPELGKHALLTRRDREAFAMLCEDVAIARAALDTMRPDKRKGYAVIEEDPDQGRHKGRTKRATAFAVYRASVDSYRRWCVEFGLSPRARVGFDPTGGLPAPPGDDDDDDDLFD